MQFQETKSFILNKLKKELPPHLSYHSIDHIKDVYDSCKTIAKSEGVDGVDLKLLLTAALFHDSGFIVQQKGHEQISCEIVREYLPDFNYTPQQIEKICGMIMATKIPQSPNNLLEEIIADADLDYLGRDSFFEIGNKLFSELSFYGYLTFEDWNKIQVKFLEAHRFFTKTTIKNRNAKKIENLNIVKKLVEDANTGA